MAETTHANPSNPQDSDLVVPYAFNAEGRLVAARYGQPGASYRCAACRESVVCRRAWVEDGIVRRRSHFAHGPEAGCSSESALHSTAKALAAQVVADWLEEVGEQPRIRVKCRCGGEREPLYLPDAKGVELEKGVGGFVADVRVDLADGKRAAIEVVVTNPMSTEKRECYEGALGWWVEVDAKSVLEEPLMWRALSMGGAIEGAEWSCRECVRKRAAQATEIARAAEKARRDLREAEEKLYIARKAMVGPINWEAETEKLRAAYEQEHERVANKRRELSEVVAELGASHESLAVVRDALMRDDTRLMSLKMTDLRTLENTYREVFARTENVRINELRLRRAVHRHEVRMGLRDPMLREQEPDLPRSPASPPSSE